MEQLALCSLSSCGSTTLSKSSCLVPNTRERMPKPMAATPPNDQKGIGTVDLADFETEAAELDIETGLDYELMI
jgi:hypothetical protein